MVNKPKKIKLRVIRAAIAVLILLRIVAETSTADLKDADTYLASVEKNIQMETDAGEWGISESDLWGAADAVMVEIANLHFDSGDTAADTTALAAANEALKLLL